MHQSVVLKTLQDAVIWEVPHKDIFFCSAITFKMLKAPRNSLISKHLLGHNRETGPQGVNRLSFPSFHSVYTSQLRLIEARWFEGGHLTPGQDKNPEGCKLKERVSLDLELLGREEDERR